MPPQASFQIGWCTSGLAHHRLEDGLQLVADFGYRSVFLTLDVNHLDPFQPGLAHAVAKTASLLERLRLLCVVETGARYLLDPRRKHQPTLISNHGGDLREHFLSRAIGIAADLGSRCVSFWSGANADGVPEAEAWARLSSRVHRLCAGAQAAGVQLAFEPEPGMFVETVAGFHELRRRIGEASGLKLSLDCGHLLVTGEPAPHEVVLREKDHLACVAIEDMRRGVHEHLPFGEGQLALPPLIDALAHSGFAGAVAVELPRHSHDAPRAMAHARGVLEPLGVAFGPR